MRGSLAEHIEASTEDHMQLLLKSLSDAKQQSNSLPALEEKVKNLEKENRLLKESESKRSEEAADLTLVVKQLEVDEMQTHRKLERWIKCFQRLEREFNSHKEETAQLKREIARGRKEVNTTTRKQKGMAKAGENCSSNFHVAKAIETRRKCPSTTFTSRDDSDDDLWVSSKLENP